MTGQVVNVDGGLVLGNLKDQTPHRTNAAIDRQNRKLSFSNHHCGGKTRIAGKSLPGEDSPLRYLVPLFVVAACQAANAQEHRTHPSADLPLHEKFYSTWFMPDQPTRSCCNKADCYPTEVRLSGDIVYARRREDGKWLSIPAQKIERNRDSPDGRSHLCAPPPTTASSPDTVYCFALGSGT